MPLFDWSFDVEPLDHHIYIDATYIPL